MYHVVLEFDSEASAKEFVHENVLYDGWINRLWRGKVIGVFKRPTKFCDCPEVQKVSKGNTYRNVQGQKYGWWVHDKCGRPTHHYADTANDAGWFVRSYQTFGSNLLPRELQTYKPPNGKNAYTRRVAAMRSSVEWRWLLDEPR
ncbi:MAG TPA: hypothetical protein VM715_05730 [Candidatus Acidoferrum sp.]|jgi:hypothetical protein|nr:hypothetical protein [Candidatus Acidoferrum sp.]